MKHHITRLIVGCVMLLALVALVVFVWFKSVTAVVPEFYQAAQVATQRPQELKTSADRFEQAMLATRNDWEKQRPWRLVLRASDLNAWLARSSAASLAEHLPRTWSQPRFAVQDGQIFAAVQLSGDLSGVLAVQVEPFLTNRPRQLALRIRSVTLGSLPIPESQWKEQLTTALTNAELPAEWLREEDDPVLQITLPLDAAQEHSEWLFTNMAVQEGEIVVEGESRLKLKEK